MTTLTRRGRWLLTAGLAVAVSAAALAWLSRLTPSDGPASSSGAAAAPAPQSDITIGVVWSPSTDLFAQGLNLAVSEINAAGGVLGHPLRLDVQDDQNSVTKGIAIAQQFADDPHISAVIGHRRSFVTVAAARLYSDAHKLLLSPTSTAPSLTAQGYQLVFRSLPSDDRMGAEMANDAKQQGYKRVVILYDDDEYGHGLADAFEKAASADGLTVLDRLSYIGDSIQMKSLVRNWDALGCDAIFLAESADDGAQFITEAAQVGLHVPLLGGDAMEVDTVAHAAKTTSLSLVVPSIFDPLNQSPQSQAFVRAFQANYRLLPDKYAAQAYDAVELLAFAMRQAGSTDPERMADVLHKQPHWVGVTGDHSFTASGDVLGMPILKKALRDGRFVTLSK